MLIGDAGEERELESIGVMENVEIDSSSFGSEDVKDSASLKFERIGPHSNHFSTLCLEGDMKIEPPEPMNEFGDENQCVFILKFVMPRRQNGIPHLKAKKCKMRYSRVGLLAFLPPPHEHHRNLDSKLGRKFISSKWKEKWMQGCKEVKGKTNTKMDSWKNWKRKQEPKAGVNLRP
ncbi:uncharacterized protein LOC132066646 [Lycium ferocissimum]|uniref:uncharacterized protein LOC132066646 n=1 Tax=Lycium ferocissimum TaxID=112874 RepID=UPI002815526F|nr:uncharacterized protein LOC132066646 [Lycium ferocissimum]